MHEFAIAENIISIVNGELDRNGCRGRTVTGITLTIGKMAGIVPDSLRFGLEMLMRDTPLAAAGITIHETNITAACGDCRDTFTLPEPLFICPGCGGARLEMLTGREMKIDSIEVDD